MTRSPNTCWHVCGEAANPKGSSPPWLHRSSSFKWANPTTNYSANFTTLSLPSCAMNQNRRRFEHTYVSLERVERTRLLCRSTLTRLASFASLPAKTCRCVRLESWLTPQERFPPFQDTVELMKSLEAIFSRSYLRSDGTSPTIDQHVQALHTAALSSWCLLMSTLPTNLAHEFIRM